MIVDNHQTLRHAMMKKWRHFRKAAFSFSGWIGLLETWRGVKTMGTRGKINAIWWNIKINLQKLVRIWIANKSAKFHAKRLNQSENIPKSFIGGGATFFLKPCTLVIWYEEHYKSLKCSASVRRAKLNWHTQQSTFSDVWMEGFRLVNTKCMSDIELWKKILHPNLVHLREVFTTKAFGDNCMYTLLPLSLQLSYWVAG